MILRRSKNWSMAAHPQDNRSFVITAMFETANMIAINHTTSVTMKDLS